MHADADTLVASLRTRGMRMTSARRAICEVLAASHDDHLSAVEIRALAEERAAATIDQSTVYRTLDILEEVGLIRHVHLGHGPGVVHLREHEAHHHLVCDTCGAAIDVPLSEFAPLVSRLEEAYGFAADPAHFGIDGTFSACRAAGEPENEHSRNSPA